MTEIQIKSFHPLNVTLPATKEVSGKVRILLPDIHVQVWDLSMGIPELNGAHLGSDVPLYGVNIELEEPMETAKLMAFIIEAQDTLEQAWRLAMGEFDKRGALL